MRCLIVVLGVLGFALSAMGQTGEVDRLSDRAAFWWQADSLASGPTINGHPSAPANTLQLPDQITSAGAVSIFTVYVPDENAEEQLLWSITQKEQLETVLTTHRLAQLQRGDFRNFQDTAWVPARLHSYYARVAEDELRLSFLPTPPANLPVVGFGGSLAEVLVFDAVLSSIERQRVETYLALKYGLTLSADYLDRSGNTLQAIVDADHKWRVAGLGHDPFFGFRQNQSQSVFATDLLHLSSEVEIDEGAFLVVADDNAPLSLMKPAALQPLTSQRSWQLTATNWCTKNSLHLAIDTSAFAKTAHAGYHWWVRHSAEGVPASYAPLRDDGEALPVFELSIPASTGKSMFQVVYGPALLPNIELYPPSCTSDTRGEVRIAAAGLHFPVSYAVYDEFGDRLERGMLSGADAAAYVQLAAGEYRLELEDAVGTRFSESWFFQASDAPVLDLEETYFLASGELLALDLSLNEGAKLSWVGSSDGAVSTEKRTSTFAIETDAEVRKYGNTDFRFSTSIPGTYTLIAKEDECEARHTLRVAHLRKKDNIAALSVWPNPSSDGYFQLQANLHQAAAAEVELVDVAGRVLYHQALSEVTTCHSFAGRILQKGFYFVHFKTRESSAVRKLVVE